MYEVAEQKLLVTEPPTFDGFEVAPNIVNPVVERILNKGNPQFMDRALAESTSAIVQVVPYAYIRNQDERYFMARRKAEHVRSELRSKFTLMVGGHAERNDWNERDQASVFERCLRRELDEELIGLEIKSVKQIGIINDSRSRVGSQHLAIVFEVCVGGAPRVRRQASDQEFGREAVAWKSPDEIRQMASSLDPWSQIVAHRQFGAPLPERPNEPTLFTRIDRRNDERV